MDPSHQLIWLRKHETKSKFTTRQTAGRQTDRKGGLVTVGGEIQIGSWAQIQSGESANPALAAFNIADSPPARVGSNLLARRSQTLCASSAKMIMKKKMCGLKNPATRWKRNLGKEIRICKGSKSNLRIEQILPAATTTQRWPSPASINPSPIWICSPVTCVCLCNNKYHPEKCWLLSTIFALLEEIDLGRWPWPRSTMFKWSLALIASSSSRSSSLYSYSSS